MAFLMLKCITQFIGILIGTRGTSWKESIGKPTDSQESKLCKARLREVSWPGEGRAKREICSQLHCGGQQGRESVFREVLHKAGGNGHTL